MTEAECRVLDQRLAPLLEEYFSCWKLVAFSHQGTRMISSKFHNDLENDALQEGLRTIFRECEEPIPVVEYEDAPDEGEEWRDVQ